MVVLDSMPCVVEEEQGLLLAGIPVHYCSIIEFSHKLLELFSTCILFLNDFIILRTQPLKSFFCIFSILISLGDVRIGCPVGVLTKDIIRLVFDDNPDEMIWDKVCILCGSGSHHFLFFLLMMIN